MDVVDATRILGRDRRQGTGAKTATSGYGFEIGLNAGAAPRVGTRDGEHPVISLHR